MEVTTTGILPYLTGLRGAPRWSDLRNMSGGWCHAARATHERPAVTAIAWTVTDPDTIERMIAVGLCRRHKHARRIKASQGDGGLDVIVPVPGRSQLHVEDYQVKKFADELNDSRKQQIKKSLANAIATHTGTTYGYEIAKWYLALPMDFTREQEKWLFDLADELEAPFPVEIFGLTPIEELLLEAPSIREYYIGDGVEKVSQILSQMTNLAGLRDLTVGPLKIEPADVTGSLASLHTHINAADPHFNYNYQVTTELPTITPGPGLIASIIARTGMDAPFVTWHVSTKYDAALDDRPIPGSFTVYPDRMTAEQRGAWERWCKYGTPVVLEGDSITNVTLDLPGGLAADAPTSESVLSLGVSFEDLDREQTTRASWIIEDPDGAQLADKTLDFRLLARGLEGGEHRQGTDSDGYLTVDLYSQITSTTGGTMEGGLTLHGDRWVGEPVQRILPMLRFCAAWGNDNRLKVQDEFGLIAPAHVRVLQGAPPIPPIVVSVVEDLVRISAATGRPIGLPEDLSAFAGQGGSSLRVIADVLSGIEIDVRAGEFVMWYEDHPEACAELTARAALGGLIVPWPVPFAPFGDDFRFRFMLEILGPATIKPEAPSEGQPASRKAVRMTLSESTRGRLRLCSDRQLESDG